MKAVYQFPSIPEQGVIAYTEGNIVRVFFDFQECQPEPISKEEEEAGIEIERPTLYECEQVDVTTGRTYGDIVSAIVNDKYSPDDVQAILANYTEIGSISPYNATEEKAEEYTEEYDAFQSWRKKAKDVAQIVLEIIG